VNSEHS